MSEKLETILENENLVVKKQKHYRKIGLLFANKKEVPDLHYKYNWSAWNHGMSFGFAFSKKEVIKLIQSLLEELK